MCHPAWGRALAEAQHLKDLARLRRVRDRIDREYALPLDVAALARDADMPAGQLGRQFHRAYGRSPYAHLMERRIARATALFCRGDRTGQDSRSAGRRATTSVTDMNSIASITLEVADLTAADRFYTAFGVGTHVSLRASETPTDGFRGFALSLTVSQPSVVDGFIGAALDAGATTLKPAAKSFWGYGGVVRAPDGTIWKIATSEKKDKGPAAPKFDEMVLLLGAEDVTASKRFYVERGLAVAKSFGSKYVQFEAPSDGVTLALYGRRTLAKEVGVPADGTGSHRLVLGGGDAFTDPDGFAWEADDRSPDQAQ